MSESEVAGIGGSAAGSSLPALMAHAYQSASDAEAGDFKSVFASVISLALSELPFVPYFENFISVVEYDGDNAVASFNLADKGLDWTWVAGADKTTGALEVVVIANVLRILNEAVENYEAHRILEAGVHGAADTTNVVNPALYPATDMASAIALGSELRTRYEAHRILTGGGEHGAADATNTIVSADPTTWASLVTFINEFKNVTAFNAHIILTGGGEHGAPDAINEVTSIDAGTFTTGNTFVVTMRGPEPEVIDVMTDFGGPYTHQSQRDFDAKWKASATLDVGTVSAMAMVPDKDDFRAVAEIAAGGKLRRVYTRISHGFTWAPAGGGDEGVLTVVGADMLTGSTFIVFVAGPEHGTKLISDAGDATTRAKITQQQDRSGKISPAGEVNTNSPWVKITNGAINLLLAVANAAKTAASVVLVNQPIDFAGAVIDGAGVYKGQWSVGEGDLTAVRLSDTTLTLGTFPTALGTPADGQFLRVVKTQADGTRVSYLPGPYPMTLSGQVLTATGALFEATDLDYDVFIAGPPKGYDAATNAKQNIPLTRLRPRQDSPQKAASGLDDDTYHEYFDVEQGRIFTNEIVDVPGAAGDNTYTLWTSSRNDGTGETGVTYYDRTLELLGQATVTSADLLANPSDGVWTVYGFQAKRVRITMVRANDGANNDGGYEYDMMWS